MNSKTMIAALITWLLLTVPASGGGSQIELSSDLRLEPVAAGVWRHISSRDMEGWGVVAANGLVVISDGEAALIDTPWTDEQTSLLADWIEKEQGATLTIVVPTHSHGDCLGGLGAAHARGAASYASEKTIAFAKESGVVVPENGFTGRLDLSVGSFMVSLEEVGAAHTLDNIVVWLPNRKVLFGGCAVKSAKSKTMGYTKEADLSAWPTTIDRIADRWGEGVIIVPGHGTPGGSELLVRTKELIEEFTASDKGDQANE